MCYTFVVLRRSAIRIHAINTRHVWRQQQQHHRRSFHLTKKKPKAMSETLAQRAHSHRIHFVCGDTASTTNERALAQQLRLRLRHSLGQYLKQRCRTPHIHSPLDCRSVRIRRPGSVLLISPISRITGDRNRLSPSKVSSKNIKNKGTK